MVTLLIEKKALIAGSPLFSPPTVFSTCGFTLHESESTEAEIWKQGRSLSLWSPFSPPLPHFIHMHLHTCFADSAVCATIQPSFGRFVFALFYKAWHLDRNKSDWHVALVF